MKKLVPHLSLLVPPVVERLNLKTRKINSTLMMKIMRRLMETRSFSSPCPDFSFLHIIFSLKLYFQKKKS